MYLAFALFYKKLAGMQSRVNKDYWRTIRTKAVLYSSTGYEFKSPAQITICMQLMRGLSTRCHCYGVCLKQVHPDHHTQHLKSLEQNTLIMVTNILLWLKKERKCIPCVCRLLWYRLILFFPKNVTQTRKELSDLLCLSYRRGETFVILKVSVCYFTK